MKSDVGRWALFFMTVLVVVIAVRAPVLSHSVIDWDESVYLLVSSSLLDGSLPYIEVWDHKQPFLYVLFALSFLSPDPVVGMRLLACLGISITAVLLAFVVHRVAGGWLTSAAAAALYGLATLATGGLATNTEILFAPFVVGVFTVLILTVRESEIARPRLGVWFVAGLLAGLSVQVKLTAAFEIVFLVGGFIILWLRSSGCRASVVAGLVKCCGVFGLGMIGPIVLPVVIYWSSGCLDEYLFSNLGFNLSYTDVDMDRVALLRSALLRQATSGNMALLVVGSLGAAVVATMARKSQPELSRLSFVGLMWLTGAGWSVVATGKLYDHHLLQLVPSLVLLTTLVVAMAARSGGPIGRAIAVCTLVVVVSVLLVHGQQSVVAAASSPDTPRAVGEFLLENVEPGEGIYVANTQPIIYLLADVNAPTRYVQPAWIIRPEFRTMLGLDTSHFLDEVFADEPAYVVIEEDNPWLPDQAFLEYLVDRHLRGRYVPIARFESTIILGLVKDETQPVKTSAQSSIEEPGSPSGVDSGRFSPPGDERRKMATVEIRASNS